MKPETTIWWAAGCLVDISLLCVNALLCIYISTLPSLPLVFLVLVLSLPLSYSASNLS